MRMQQCVIPGKGVFSLAIGTKLLQGKTLVVNFQTKPVTVG